MGLMFSKKSWIILKITSKNINLTLQCRTTIILITLICILNTSTKSYSFTLLNNSSSIVISSNHKKQTPLLQISTILWKFLFSRIIFNQHFLLEFLNAYQAIHLLLIPVVIWNYWNNLRWLKIHPYLLHLLISRDLLLLVLVSSKVFFRVNHQLDFLKHF